MENEEEETKYNFEHPKITKLSEIDLYATYTYADYLRWDIRERLEIIKGKIFEMSAPNRNHQEIAGTVFTRLHNYLEGQSCKVYSAPFDVRLPNLSKEDDKVYTVVQPDICVIFDQSKLDFNGCIGAPDLVVEILSPGNNKKDLNIKYNLYEEVGVKEYWIIFPSERTLIAHILNKESKFEPQPALVEGDVLISSALPGFELPLDVVFKGVVEER